MDSSQRPRALRVLSIDGGGMKGYTTLIVLSRVMRAMRDLGDLPQMPKPCEIFDLIVGTSTGGLIAVMLGRLQMSVDECIIQYEQLGRNIFGKRPRGGRLGRLAIGLAGSSFYSTEDLQQAVKTVLRLKSVDESEPFRSAPFSGCKTMLCVTRVGIATPDLLRSYASVDVTQENYDCTIWEAASATAAAPLFFKPVSLRSTGDSFCDGGLRRNNPINEAILEVDRIRSQGKGKAPDIGCVVSIGTGAPSFQTVSNRVHKLIAACVAMMADSRDIAEQFATSELGRNLSKTDRYFRFNVPQGMDEIQLDDWEATARMRDLTLEYLRQVGNGNEVERCARSLLDPEEILRRLKRPKFPSTLRDKHCINWIRRSFYADQLDQFYLDDLSLDRKFVIYGPGGVGKTQIALGFAWGMKKVRGVLWIRSSSIHSFIEGYTDIFNASLECGWIVEDFTPKDTDDMIQRVNRALEQHLDDWLMVLDGVDSADLYKNSPNGATSIADSLPKSGRILITTRDVRFLGLVARTSDGIQVSVLSGEEATGLLLNSLPTDLKREGRDRTIKELTTELLMHLENHPLAIAQATANMRETRHTLEAYLAKYQDKKRRLRLFEQPAEDIETTDPRNRLQSAFHSCKSAIVTWEVSYEFIESQDPKGAEILCYMGLFDHHNIPRAFIQICFGLDFSDDDFEASVKHLLHFGMIERYGSAQSPTYRVHPVIHEWTRARLSFEQRKTYLLSFEKHLHLLREFDELWNFLPPADGKPELSFLIHCKHICDRYVEHQIITTEVCRSLDFVTSRWLELGMYHQAIEDATTTIAVASQIYNPNSFVVIAKRGRLKANALLQLQLYEMALQEAEPTYESLKGLKPTDAGTELAPTFTDAAELAKHLDIEKAMLIGLLAKSYFALGRRADANRVIGEGHSNDASTVSGLTSIYNRAQSFVHDGNIVEAQRCLAEIDAVEENEMEPKLKEIYVEAKTMYGVLMIREGKVDEGLSKLQDAITLGFSDTGEHFNAWQSCNVICEQLHKPFDEERFFSFVADFMDKAQDLFHRICPINDRKSMSYVLGMCGVRLFENGRFQDAIPFLRSALLAYRLYQDQRDDTRTSATTFQMWNLTFQGSVLDLNPRDNAMLPRFDSEYEIEDLIPLVFITFSRCLAFVGKATEAEALRTRCAVGIYPYEDKWGLDNLNDWLNKEREIHLSFQRSYNLHQGLIDMGRLIPGAELWTRSYPLMKGLVYRFGMFSLPQSASKVDFETKNQLAKSMDELSFEPSPSDEHDNIKELRSIDANVRRLQDAFERHISEMSKPCTRLSKEKQRAFRRIPVQSVNTQPAAS